MKTVRDLQVAGKVVFCRCDFNVPLKDGVIRDDNRIVQALPTIKELIAKGARVVLMSHLGKIDHKDPVKCEEGKKKNNMAPIAVRLGELLGKEVKIADDVIGESAKKLASELKDGDVSAILNLKTKSLQAELDLNK